MPNEFSILGGMVAFRCPSEVAPLVRLAGGTWEPGSPLGLSSDGAWAR
jgi:hypothetical protein